LISWSAAVIEKFQVMNSMIGPEPDHRGADADAREAGLGDRRVDDPLLAEAREHALGHLVGAVVVPDLLAHQEDGLVALHLLDHGLASASRKADDARLRLRHSPSPSRAPERRLLRELHRILYLRLDLVVDRLSCSRSAIPRPWMRCARIRSDRAPSTS
jgi:hypothetical protein